MRMFGLPFTVYACEPCTLQLFGVYVRLYEIADAVWLIEPLPEMEPPCEQLPLNVKFGIVAPLPLRLLPLICMFAIACDISANSAPVTATASASVVMPALPPLLPPSSSGPVLSSPQPA